MNECMRRGAVHAARICSLLAALAGGRTTPGGCKEWDLQTKERSQAPEDFVLLLSTCRVVPLPTVRYVYNLRIRARRRRLFIIVYV